MKSKFYLEDNPGEKGIILGNVAIARGLFEAGVKIAAGYPGTPSSEIMPALAEMAAKYPEKRINCEWSVNEKVAFEVAFAGSVSNARSVAIMKHVGVNVASDAFMTACYMGAKGGFVLISADDPSQFSSQNEQDNRHFGSHAQIPIFEPSSPQEAKDMMKYAFEFSEFHKSIVLFRTTTRLNHGRGDVEIGQIEKFKRKYEFDWNRSKYVCVPSNMRPQRVELLERMKKITQIADDFPFNSLQISIQKMRGKKIGFLSAGIPYSTMIDVLNHYKITDQVSILKLGLVHPMPQKLMKELLENCEEILVVEELEPIFENELKKFAYECGLTEVKIHGKDILPQNGEFSAELLLEKIAEFTGTEFNVINNPTDIIPIPPRLPQMCPGCSHRPTFFALNQISRKLRKKFVNCTDIGCYTLGSYKPLEIGDISVCMGGSLGLANGFAKLMGPGNPVVALLGDSTFFHSGIPGLINAVYNKNDLLLIILDNSYTSMTGGQNNPGNGIKIGNEPGTKVSIENLVRGCGITDDRLWVEESNDLPRLTKRLEQALKATGVRVFISRHVCSLVEMRMFKKKGVSLPKIQVNESKCIGCQICIRQFGCPAIQFDFEKRKAFVDQIQCRSCEVCIDVCPQQAFQIQK